jgi:futalosine hydrolase
MKTILVTAATPVEISLLIRETGARERVVKGIPSVHEFQVSGKRVIVAATGIGKVNAASCSTSLVCGFSADILVNTGCAGAYMSSGFSVGDLALASSEIYGDEGVLTPSGWQPLDFIGIPLAEERGNRYFNEVPLSISLREKALQFARCQGIPLATGKFVTVSTCSGTAARGAELSNRFDAVCENMEGAAVAHVALRHGIDCVEIRGISNMVEDRDLSRWDITGAAEKAQRFILKFIETL